MFEEVKTKMFEVLNEANKMMKLVIGAQDNSVPSAVFGGTIDKMLIASKKVYDTISILEKQYKCCITPVHDKYLFTSYVISYEQKLN